MTGWRGRRVTITGGAGFIGSNLARRLVGMGAAVRVVDNLERGRPEFIERLDLEFLNLDLRNALAALRAVDGADVVFHLAAQVGGIRVYRDRAGSVLNKNLLIDQNVFAAVVARRFPRLFYASSAHVYPRCRQQSPDAAALREEDTAPVDPVLSYGWGKLVGEVSLLALADQYPWIHVAIARIMGAYGYNQDFGLETGSVIPVLCRRLAMGEPFRLWGTGRETRSYVFIEDVVDAMIRSVDVMDYGARVVGPVNLAVPGRVTIRELATRVAAAAGKAVQPEFDMSDGTAIWGQAADCSKAEKILGWRAAIGLDDGLLLTYRDVERRLVKAQAVPALH